MNTILITGVVAGAPRLKTSSTGVAKLEFNIESLTKTQPLYLQTIAFGNLAESSTLADGQGVIVIGRLEPSTREGCVVGLTVLATNIETLDDGAGAS